MPRARPLFSVTTCNARKLRAEPPECDPAAFSARLGGLSANLQVENAPIELDFFYGDYIDGEAGCLEKCQENPECFAFDITADAECAPALIVLLHAALWSC